VDTILAAGGQAVAFAADVTKLDQVEALLRRHTAAMADATFW
jgi:hypothetical protein